MKSTSIRKALCAAACVITASASTSALATAHLEVQASAIQIQNNGSTNPSLFYTGSVCSAQHLNLDDNASVDVQKLLWASVFSAKANGSKMSFDYDYNGDICVIRSFAVMPN